MQGFEPAILAREILMRKRAVNGRGWLLLCVTAICLAFSACYEFIEWWASVAQGSAADAFLGTQGDVWDTQWDMFMALIGALCAQLALGRLHDSQLKNL
jgi:putative membrane protein